MDPAMAYLNGLLDSLHEADLRRSAQLRVEAMEEESSVSGGIAQEVYELKVMEQARAIVAGGDEPPTVEHLRVLLDRLDSALPAPEEEEGKPF